jgi:hypothetical protein
VAEAMAAPLHPPEWKLGQGDSAVSLSFTHVDKIERIGGARHCTYMRARCARYKAGGFKAVWASQSYAASGPFQRELVNDTGHHIEYLVEDMCPYAHSGLVDGPWHSRAVGEAPGRILFGFGSTSLKRALSDVASEARAQDRAAARTK